MISFHSTHKKIALAVLLASSLCFCSRPPKEIKRVKLLMGTKVEILAQGKDQAIMEAAVNKGFDEIERLEKKLSRFEPDSVVSRINQNAGQSPVQVDSEVFGLIEKSVAVCKESNGAFEITILPVLSLWKYNDANPKPPSSQEVREKLNLVDCKKIILKKDQNLVFLPEPGMAIDLGGIAKGYAADKAAQKLRQNGVSAGIVNAGGNLTVFGGTGKGMAVGIQDPRKRGKILAKIYITDGAISTSGDYERFFIYNGVRYSHIIDPRTGYPAQGEESVTIFAENGADADAWSTALFVLGSDQGLKILAGKTGFSALFIDESGKIVSSPGLSQRLVELKGEN